MRLTRPFPFAFSTTSRAQAIGSRSLRCGCNMRPCRGQWAEAAARACLRGVALESTLSGAIRRKVECASPAHVRQGGRLVGSTSNPAIDGVVDLWVDCVSPPAAFPSALSPAPAAFIDNVLLGHGRPRLMDGRITPGVGCGISFAGRGRKDGSAGCAGCVVVGSSPAIVVDEIHVGERPLGRCVGRAHLILSR